MALHGVLNHTAREFYRIDAGITPELPAMRSALFLQDSYLVVPCEALEFDAISARIHNSTILVSIE